MTTTPDTFQPFGRTPDETYYRARTIAGRIVSSETLTHDAINELGRRARGLAPAVAESALDAGCTDAYPTGPRARLAWRLVELGYYLNRWADYFPISLDALAMVDRFGYGPADVYGPAGHDPHPCPGDRPGSLEQRRARLAAMAVEAGARVPAIATVPEPFDPTTATSYRYPAKSYDAAGRHIGPGLWLDHVHEANRVRPGTFAAPDSTGPWWAGGYVEEYEHARIIHHPGDNETVTVTPKTATGARVLAAAAPESA